MDISVFFQPYEPVSPSGESAGSNRLLRQVTFFSGDDQELEGKKVALIGVKEERGSDGNAGCAEGPDAIRDHLYRLFRFDGDLPWIDLGNIEPGSSIEDTYYAINQSCQVLLKKNIIPLIIGGSQDLTYANYLAYEKMEQTVNVVTIDQRLDFGPGDTEVRSQGYLNKIVLHKPNFLFNYSNIGHQRYLTDPDLLDLMGKMYFDAFRLGEIQPALHLAEPVIRNADIISLDVSAVRQSEAPGCAHAGPNGFYGDQLAQLARYAGMSDKLSSFGVYEYNPRHDPRGQTAHLMAQVIWCFLEGVSQRKEDYPIGDYSEYTKYIVHLQNEQHELTFYKSNKSDRWWMDVPYPNGQDVRYDRHHLVPCSYEEYQQATNEEVPDRWWKTYQKLV